MSSAVLSIADRWHATRVGIAFFLSGAAALIYQVAWQRLLFVAVGVDLESVTIVVSTFMLGLGLGAVLGGWLADRLPGRILVAFCLFEAAIALYGAFSTDLLLASAAAFAGLGRTQAAALSFALLLLPTVAMGATLPMLVADATARSGNVGVSTGTLYFINTLGAALGSMAVGFLLLYWLDLRQATLLAAALNALASATVATALVGGRGKA
jgi:predicted membrane-bound spermidine synthase